MRIEDYKRAVRCLGDVQLNDRAVVIARQKENGQIVITNCGDPVARQLVYDTLKMVPIKANTTTTTRPQRGGDA